MLAALLSPTPLDWLFGAGIGTNIGASIFWALVAGAGGWWLKGHAARIHASLAALHESHAALHSKLDAHHAQHAAAIEALHQRVSADGRGASTSAHPAPRAFRSPR